jgi:hypothetical protein
MLQDAITQKDYDAKRDTVMIEKHRIPKSYLNVFLTAQFYTGILGVQVDVEENEEIKELKEQEEREK